MTRYVADHETGAPICADCAEGDHGLCAGPCEGDWCQCPCQADRAREMDDRPAAALANIARDIERENRPSVTELTAERYDRTTPAPPGQITYAKWVRFRACERKQRHATLFDARRVVLKIWREGRWATTYCCEWCKGWHITSERAEAA